MTEQDEPRYAAVGDARSDVWPILAPVLTTTVLTTSVLTTPVLTTTAPTTTAPGLTAGAQNFPADLSVTICRRLWRAAT